MGEVIEGQIAAPHVSTFARCERCRFFAATADRDGECRRTAPMMGRWPSVARHWWCGQFEAARLDQGADHG